MPKPLPALRDAFARASLAAASAALLTLAVAVPDTAFAQKTKGGPKSQSTSSTPTTSAAPTTTGTTTDAIAPDTTYALSPKIALDLQAAILSGLTPKNTSWVRDVNGVRYVKAIVVGMPAADPELTALRGSVMSAGGSVYFR